jgi:acyl-CoA reductase-like NAD-dependent aldehyde dehydrogenase
MKLLISGEFVDSERGASYEVRNPADTREVVGTAVKGTLQDARRAIDSAQEAFRKWSETSPRERGRILLKAADLVRQSKEDIAVLITKENGKPLVDARGESDGLANILEYYAGLWPALRGAHVPMADPSKFALVMKRPIGVCGAILPWNNPITQFANKIAPALIVGDTVVAKPASTTPLSVGLVGELMLQSGLPPGVLNIVTGPGSVVGEELVQNKKVRHVTLTGETETGKKIMRLAAEQVKKLTLELGGSDPMIVCDDADLDRAADAAAFGRFRNTGQGCMCVKRLFVFEDIANEFMRKLTEKVSMIKVGNGMDPGTKMGPCHSDNQRKVVEDQVADATERGAKLVAGGRRPTGPKYDHGYFYLPTLMTDVDPESRIATEECFGPALPMFTVSDFDEAIEAANRSMFGLSSYVFTKDINRAIKAAEKIESGKTLINTGHDSSIELPHGGVKMTGLGREHGLEAFDAYTEPKVLLIDTNTTRTPWIPDNL